MKKRPLIGLAISVFVLGISSLSQADSVTPEIFSTGFNTGYSVTGSGPDIDGNVDWFVFDSNGITPTSFYFDRTVAAPDLIAGLYMGDTTGFDYAAAGAPYNYSYNSADAYNPSLNFIQQFDDSHDDALGGEYGDPDFNLVLSPGRYSLALSSLGRPGTYEFTTNAVNAYPTPVPAAIWLFASGFAGIAGIVRRRKNK